MAKPFIFIPQMAALRKMRVFPMSDLHLEMYQSGKKVYELLKPKLPEADVLVLAGDIGYPQNRPFSKIDHRQNYKDFLTLIRPHYPRVVLIAGNHEYYPSLYDRKACFQALAELCKETDVDLLEKSSVTIDGVKFIGTTLWSAIDELASGQMNDFRTAFQNRIEYLMEFSDCYKWLKTELEFDFDANRTVVITHHLPTNRLIHPKYADSSINSGFATDILDTLEMHKVSLWVCGHTHEGKTIKYGDSVLTTNPMGYPNERKDTAFQFETFEV